MREDFNLILHFLTIADVPHRSNCTKIVHCSAEHRGSHPAISLHLACRYSESSLKITL